MDTDIFTYAEERQEEEFFDDEEWDILETRVFEEHDNIIYIEFLRDKLQEEGLTEEEEEDLERLRIFEF